MTKSKKLLAIILGMIMVFALAACGGGEKTEESKEESKTEESAKEESKEESKTEESAKEESKEESSEVAGGKATGAINVVSREEGSGTRGAFTEITGVTKDKVDNTTPNAAIQNGTNNVMTYVAGDAQSIGYISLGSLDESVKALKVDGVEATEENVAAEKYPVSRPFNICYKEDKLSDLAKDFIAFIMSKEGQELALKEGVVPADAAAKPYEKAGDMEGEIIVQGSTSVAPYMEVLEEAYMALHPGVKFNHTANGSGEGIKAAIEEIADIGMASRELKQEELDQGVTPKAIAIDGIAVIVSPENPTEDITLEQIRQIFTGEVENWDDL